MEAKLYRNGFKRVNFYNLTDGTEVCTYLEVQGLDKMIVDFRQGNGWNVQHFCEYVNRLKEFEVIKIINNGINK